MRSRRHSNDSLNADDSADEHEDLLQAVFTEEIRRGKRRNLTIWAAISGVLFLYISFVLGFFWDQWQD